MFGSTATVYSDVSRAAFLLMVSFTATAIPHIPDHGVNYRVKRRCSSLLGEAQGVLISFSPSLLFSWVFLLTQLLVGWLGIFNPVQAWSVRF